MTDATRAPRLEPARFNTNCRGCAAPIRAGDPALPRPRTGALACAVCAPRRATPARGAPRRRGERRLVSKHTGAHAGSPNERRAVTRHEPRRRTDEEMEERRAYDAGEAIAHVWEALDVLSRSEVLATDDLAEVVEEAESSYHAERRGPRPS